MHCTQRKKTLNIYVKVLYGWKAFPAKNLATFVVCSKDRHCQDIKEKHSGCRRGIILVWGPLQDRATKWQHQPFCNAEYKTNLNSIISVRGALT